MAFFSRLGSRSLLTQAARFQNNGSISLARNVTLRPQAVTPDPIEEHVEKNRRLNRPLSPHLTIYAPQLTSMLSISHRITGVMLGGYAMGFGCLAFMFEKNDVVNAISTLTETNPVLCNMIRAAIAIPFAYHLVAGLRHTYWDLGFGVDTIGSVYTSGYIMLGAFALVTILLLAYRIEGKPQPVIKKK